TRSGCSSNLELLNSVPIDFEKELSEEKDVARDAFAFFQHAAKNVDEEIGRIVLEWLEETASIYSWLKEPVNSQIERKMQLIHTYGGNIWDRLVQRIERDRPLKFLLASPFHDADGGACHRLANQ